MSAKINCEPRKKTAKDDDGGKRAFEQETESIRIFYYKNVVQFIAFAGAGPFSETLYPFCARQPPIPTMTDKMNRSRGTIRKKCIPAFNIFTKIRHDNKQLENAKVANCFPPINSPHQIITFQVALFWPGPRVIYEPQQKNRFFSDEKYRDSSECRGLGRRDDEGQKAAGTCIILTTYIQSK